jgi:pilus assembly protein CpaB
VRSSTVIMIVIAVLFGVMAVFLAQSWLHSQAEIRARSMQASHRPPAAQTIVVAARPLRYGHQLAAESLREIPWPEGVLPQGAFATVPDVLKDGKRIVLTAIEPNEPVLTVKITGPGQRATLSSLVQDGYKAVTIRVNDVDGVGGFVLPGDRVDVALTRQVDKDNASTQVILQDVRVLAIDQVADERTSNPAVAKSVTLEVDTVAAQKLSLAGSIGTLSLMLRKAGESSAEKSLRVTLKDLFSELVPERGRGGSVTVTVRRGATQESFNVPAEGARRSAAATDGGPARR